MMKLYDFRGDLTDISAEKLHWSLCRSVLRFSRNIGYVTPKNIYFYYQKNKVVGSKYPEKK